MAEFVAICLAGIIILVGSFTVSFLFGVWQLNSERKHRQEMWRIEREYKNEVWRIGVEEKMAKYGIVMEWNDE